MMLNDAIEEEPSLEDRLIQVKLAIQKATTDALKTSGAVEPSGDFFDKKDDPNASFHLGMELFGQEASLVERNVREKLESIEDELQSVLQEMSEEASGNNDGEEKSSKSPQEIQQESEQLRVKILFLRECSSARSLLDESITLSSPSLAPNETPDFPQAAKLQVQAQQALRRAQDIVAAESNQSAPAVVAANKIMDPIRSSVRRQKMELIGHAKKTWHACVALTANTLLVRDSSNLATAYDVLEVFAETENFSLEDILRAFTRDLHREVFQPVLESHLANAPMSNWTVNESEEQVGGGSLVKQLGHSKSTKESIHRLEWSREDDILGTPTHKPSTSSLSNWKDNIDLFQRVLSFTANHVLLNRTSVCQFVGKRLFGKPEATADSMSLEAVGLESLRIGDDHGLLREPLLTALETTCLPNYLDPNDLGRLKSLATELGSFLTPFLRELETKQLLSDGGDVRLTTFASSFEEKYMDKRRCTLLNKARNLLLNNDYHNTVEVGVDTRPNKDDERLGMDDGLSVFKLGKSSISDTASQLMALCRETMDEAVSQQSVSQDSPLARLPATLYRTAREILDLFRAIIPVTKGHEIANVPRTAAVFHNDCVYLAHNCQTMGLEYKEKFPPVEPEDSRGSLLRQTCIFVDMVPLFRDLAERSMSDMLDLQAKQIVELVGERIAYLGQSLRSDEIVAEWSEAENATNAGLYHLRHLTQAWKPVLSYDVLNRSVGYLADVLFTLLLDQVSQATDISANACQFVGTQFEKVINGVDELTDSDKSGCRLWNRFWAVGRFMDMSLADIQVALSDGVFRHVSGPELSKLVTSCFDDSPKRRNLLKLLSSNP